MKLALALLSLSLAISAGAAAAPRLASLSRVNVRAYRFTGNTVYSAAELTRVIGDYVGRELTSEELETARRALTKHYTDHGYINSGALIPDQEVTDGIIEVRIVEGQLTAITVTGNRRLGTRYLRDRVAHWGGTPLNVESLRDGLHVLRQNPNVQQVNADLQPGTAPGQSELLVRVLDRQPFWAALQVDNARPPSVGAEQISLAVGSRNLSGHSDALELNYGLARIAESDPAFMGLDNLGGSYALPFTVRDTVLRVYGNKNDYAIIEEPFSLLDITSESHRYGLAVRQPIYRTAHRELALALSMERRESETSLLGLPFSLSPGAVNGQEKLSALRFSQEWLDRTPQQVLALRSTFSLGVDLFGTTDNGTDRDAHYWSWLGQLQYVRRLGGTQNQLLFRADVQWTDEPLLSLEQFAVGGANSVRGYRENQLVRDRGVYSGIEVRVPVLLSKTGVPLVQLAPFVDVGGGWNARGGTPSPRTIASAGLGLLMTPSKHLHGQLYWGQPFRNVGTSGDLQDAGIHFLIRADAF